MKRVWIVDDRIPAHELYTGPLPLCLDASCMRHLLENVAPEAWDEGAVRALCEAICEGEFDATFFVSPQDMTRALKMGALPPHAVIFDWEYPASNPAQNIVAITALLENTFAYVQVYTHLGGDAIDVALESLRENHAGRVLPTRMKGDVAPKALAAELDAAWAGTIAGELADRVREAVRNAVERSLIDFCGVPRGAIAAMVDGTYDNLLQVVLSRVSEEISLEGGAVLEEIIDAQHDATPNEDLRRLMSIWYYLFPGDDRVRRGDLIEIDGDLGLVVTPPCDLVKFPKKTGRRLTWLRSIRLDEVGVEGLRRDGYKLNDFGNSIIAGHGKAGEAIVVLPNVPRVEGRRDSLDDYVVLCHAWESQVFKDARGGVVTYGDLGGLRRRCTLADPFASAVASRVTGVISSPGAPDLPKGELQRLKKLLVTDVP